MKRILALICSFTLLFAFSACGTGTHTEKDDGVIVENNGDKIYAENAYADGSDSAKTPQRLKISFTEAGFGRKWLIDISKAFVRKNPEYMIVLDGDPALTSSMATKLESGKNLSDIFMPLNSAWENYAYQGWLEPLDDVYAEKPDGETGKTNEEKMDDVYREYSSLSTKEGTHYYIMPWNDTVTGIVYNVKMFEKYGWEIPETTDELETLCKKILSDTEGGVKPFAYPGKIGGYFDYIGSTWWMQSSGTDGVKEFFDFSSSEVYNASSQPALGKKQALEEFLKFFSLEKGYSVTGSMSKDHITSQMDFVNGKAAMIINANWLECEMQTSMPEGFTMGMMSVPYLSTAKKDGDGNYIKVNYTAPPDYIVIPKKADNVEGAKAFLTFMNSDEMLKLYTAETGSPRPFSYDLDSMENLSKFVVDILTLRKESDSYFDFSRSPVYMNGYAQKYIGGQPYAALIRGEMTPQRFCNVEYVEADEKWDTWLSSSAQ